MKLYLFLIVFLLSPSVEGEQWWRWFRPKPTPVLTFWYVTPDGAGLKDGSDWSNACDGFTGACDPGSLVRGNVYFVADGDYRIDGPLAFLTAASNTLRISIKKATISNHGSPVGWTDGLGDGEAIFDTITFGSPYWTWDGQVGEGTTGFGFKIKPQTCVSPTTTTQTALNLGAGNTAMQVHHVEIAHCGEDVLADGSTAASCSPAGSCGFSSDGIRSCNAITTRGLQISHVYIHDLTRNGITLCLVDDALIEQVRIERLHSADPGVHGQAIQFTQPPMNNITVRYSTFVDIAGTAALSWLGSNGQTYSNMYVYGNLFHSTTPTRYWYSPNAIYGRVGTNQTRFFIYNNTFYNVIRPKPGLWGEIVSDSESRNNVYVNSEFSSNPPAQGMTYSHNSYYNNSGPYVPFGEMQQQLANGNPFVNAEAGDFRLRCPTPSGSWLAAPYSIDRSGVTRGADGVWDRGAYEFVAANAVARSRVWWWSWL